MLQDVLQAEPADVGDHAGAGIVREQDAVLSIELGAPVNVHVACVRLRPDGLVGRHQDQTLFQQPLDRQPGPAVRRVHHADVDPALDQPLHEILLEADLGPHRDVGCHPAHQRQPLEQQALPQADAAGVGGRAGRDVPARNWRQCRRTRLVEETARAYFLFDALPPFGDAELAAAMAELEGLLRGGWPEAQLESWVVVA